MLLVPVLGFGPDVEADPLGVLQALVDGHRAAGNLVEQGERGEIRRGRQDTGAVKVPLRNSSRRWENEVDDVKKAGQSRSGRGNGRGRAISHQTREDSQESSFRHGRGRSTVVEARRRIPRLPKGNSGDSVVGAGSERRTMVLKGKLRSTKENKAACDHCDKEVWSPMKGETREVEKKFEDGTEENQVEAKVWDSKKELPTSAELDTLSAPGAHSPRKPLKEKESGVSKAEPLTAKKRQILSQRNAHKKRQPKEKAEFELIPDPVEVPETIKISSSFAGRPRFSISQDPDGKILIEPKLKDFELELKEYPETKTLQPLRKRMNTKAIKFYSPKRETKSAKASPRDFGFGSFPNFDSNIRSGFGSFGNGFESAKLYPSLRPSKVSHLKPPQAPSRPSYLQVIPPAEVSYHEPVEINFKEPTIVEAYSGPTKFVPKREVTAYSDKHSSYKVPEKGGVASNLYVEDPWKDVQPANIEYDPKPYNPKPSYGGEGSFNLGPPSSNDHYQPEPYHPDPEPYHPEPSYDPIPYHPEPSYDPKPFHAEAYEPEPYHPEPSYEPKPYHPDPYEPEPYHPEPYHPEPEYKPTKPPYHYKKPDFRPPIQPKPYVKKGHEVIKVAPLKPYVEPHHEEHTDYHDHGGGAPTSYHTSIHNEEIYHAPEPPHHPEQFFHQPETFHHSTPFSSQVHNMDVFFKDQPDVFDIVPDFGPERSFSSKSDNKFGNKNVDHFGDRSSVEKGSSSRVPRFDDIVPAHKKKKEAVTFYNPIKVPAPDILPFLEVTGTYEEDLDDNEDDNGFLHDFSQPSFHSFKLQAPRSGRSRGEAPG